LARETHPSQPDKIVRVPLTPTYGRNSKGLLKKCTWDADFNGKINFLGQEMGINQFPGARNGNKSISWGKKLE